MVLEPEAAGRGRSSLGGGGGDDGGGGGEQVAGAGGDDGGVAGSWRMEKVPARSTHP